MNAYRPAVMLYERCEDALPACPLAHRALADDALAPAILCVGGLFDYAVV